MQTSAGSFALVGRPALRDSTVAAKLRAGGAVILGKTNLSEWANFRSFHSSSGWSGRGGQCNNPTRSIATPADRAPGRERPCRRISAWSRSVRDRRQHRVPVEPERNRRNQAHGRPHEPRRRRADLPHAGHGRPPRTNRRGRGGGTERDRKPRLSMAAMPPRVACRSASAASAPGRRSRPTTRPSSNPARASQGARIGTTRQGIDGADPHVAALFDTALEDDQRMPGATLVDLDAANFVFPPGDGEPWCSVYDFKID